MNTTSNLPEPTYRFHNVIESVENTMDLVKEVLVLAKKLLML